MNGILARKLLDLLAAWVEKNGAELLDKALQLLLDKITGVSGGYAASDDPALAELSAGIDEVLAEQPSEE